jgi:hypothetical protein
MWCAGTEETRESKKQTLNILVSIKALLRRLSPWFWGYLTHP